MKRAIVTSLAILLVATMAGGTVRAQGVITAIKADFVETQFIPGKDTVPIILSEGFIFIAPDGRHRIERTTNGVKSVEIIDFAADKHIILDPQVKNARVGTTRIPMIPHVKIVPSTNGGSFTKGRDLGTKTFGPLTLHGTGFAVPHPGGNGVVTSEVWDVRFDNQVPIMLERRSAGLDEVLDQHLVNVTTVEALPSMFEIPAGYTQVPEQ